MSKLVLTIIVIVIIAVVLWVLGLIFGFFGQPGNQGKDLVNPITTNIQGMKVEILRQGRGDAAKSGDVLEVNYVSMLADGKKIEARAVETIGQRGLTIKDGYTLSVR